MKYMVVIEKGVIVPITPWRMGRVSIECKRGSFSIWRRQ